MSCWGFTVADLEKLGLMLVASTESVKTLHQIAAVLTVAGHTSRVDIMRMRDLMIRAALTLDTEPTSDPVTVASAAQVVRFVAETEATLTAKHDKAIAGERN